MFAWRTFMKEAYSIGYVQISGDPPSAMGKHDINQEDLLDL